MVKEKRFLANLDDARDLIVKLKIELPAKIDFFQLSEKSKLPWKAASLSALCFYRIVELGEVSVDLYERRLPVSAFLITRSAMETTAILYWLYEKLTKAVENNNKEEVSQFLDKAMLGSKNKLSPLDSYNSLTAIDKVEKIHEGFRENYDSLSETSHPNWQGLLCPYGKIDEDKKCLRLENNSQRLPINAGLAGLLSALCFFKLYYSKINDLLPAFVKVAEKI